MANQLQRSVFLLIVLGVLFSLPLAGKTWSAHGAGAAVATCLLVVISVLIGPLSFVVAHAVDEGFVGATFVATSVKTSVVLFLGVVLLVAWMKSLARRSGVLAPYLPVTGWALMGAYFCVSVVFAHTT